MQTIDISDILNELNVDIQAAEEQLRACLRRLDDLRAQREGVLLVLRRSQQPAPLVTNGEETADANNYRHG